MKKLPESSSATPNETTMVLNDKNKYIKLNAEESLKKMVKKDRITYNAMIKKRRIRKKTSLNRFESNYISQKANFIHLYNFEIRLPSIDSLNRNNFFKCQSLSSKKVETTFSVAFLNKNHESNSTNLLSSSSDIKSKVIEVDLTIDDDEQHFR